MVSRVCSIADQSCWAWARMRASLQRRMLSTMWTIGTVIIAGHFINAPFHYDELNFTMSMNGTDTPFPHPESVVRLERFRQRADQGFELVEGQGQRV